MQIAHKRAADSFISLHANLDLPISIGLNVDVNLAPVASLIGIGDGGGGATATTASPVHTTPTGEPGTTLETTQTTAVIHTSGGSHVAATPTTGVNGGGANGGSSIVVSTNIEGPSSIPSTTSNDAASTFTSGTTLRSKQGSTGNDAGLLVVETPSGSVSPTINTRPADTTVVNFDGSVSLFGTPVLSSPSIPVRSSTTTSSLTSSPVNPTSDRPDATGTPHSGEPKGRLTPGAIAGIVIALVILLIGAFIVIGRKRRAYRRDQAALGWSTSGSPYQYQDESSARLQDVFRRFTMPAPLTRTSSFNEETAILSPPPMAEYPRSERSSRSAASSLPRSLSSGVHRRSSSIGSTNSAGTVQSLLVDTQEMAANDTTLPMSAPPFGSSTSFVLSNPPIPTIQISPAPSPKKIFIPSYRPITIDLPPIPPLPSSPPPVPPGSPTRGRNPFEDPPG